MKLGTKMSPEAIAKIKAAKQNMSEETKQKMSLSRMGKTPWNAGLTKEDPRVARHCRSGWTQTEEAKIKMRKAKLGYTPWNAGLNKYNDSRVAVISDKLTGRERSEEHCNNISIAKTGNTIAWNEGLTIEDERVKKNIETMTTTVQQQYDSGERQTWNKGLTLETDERIASTANGYKGLTKETSEKIMQATQQQSETMKRMIESGEIKIWNDGLTKENDERVRTSAETLSEARLQLFKEGKLETWNKGAEGLQEAWNLGLTKNDHEGMMAISKARINFMANHQGKFVSSHENILAGYFDDIKLVKGKHYLRQHYIKDIEDAFLSDFFFPDFNLVIEVDGIYWHTLPGRAELDEKRNKQLQEKGYNIIRFTDKDIEDDLINVQDKIRDIILPIIPQTLYT